MGTIPVTAAGLQLPDDDIAALFSPYLGEAWALVRNNVASARDRYVL